MLEITQAQIDAILQDKGFIATCCEFASAWQFQKNGGEFRSDSDEECATDYIIWCEVTRILESMGVDTDAHSLLINVHMHTYTDDLLVLEIEFEPVNAPRKKQTMRATIENPCTDFEW